MEWLMMNADGAHSISENIGYVLDGSYIVAEDCHDTLMEISEKLQTEDPVIKQFRRQLALMEVIKKDFVPLLLNLDMDEDAESFCCLITVLADLTQPLECLQMSRQGPGNQGNVLPVMKIQEIAKLMADAQEAFQDKALITQLFSIILSILRKADSLSLEECRAVHHFFIFIQNLLYISNTNSESDITSMSYHQCILLRNFLKEGLADIILTAMNIPQWYPFCDAIVKLLAVMYTEEMNNAGGLRTIRESVAQVQENIVESDSDEAMESSSPRRDRNRLTSVVELLGVIGCLKDSLSLHDSKEESTTSTNTHQTKVSASHKLIITEISLLLEEFEWKFLQTGFTKLVLAFVNQNLKNQNQENGRSNFFYHWMMCYFLSIAHKNRIDFQYIRCVFLREVITLLTYQGFRIWFEIFSCKDGVSPIVYKQLHLIVSLFKEMLTTLQTYIAEECVKDGVEKEIDQIRYDFSTVKDLSKFFLLVLRTCKSEELGSLFLSDLIETNHLLLANIDETIQEGRNAFNLIEHIQLFATKPIINNYGNMLQSVKTNDPNLNMMIFTMLHHISGDCQKVEALLQPSVLLGFIKVGDIDYPVTQEVNDLMEYVFGLFINCVQSSPERMAEMLFPEEEDTDVTFTERESDLAISLCFECNSGDDLVNTVTERMEQSGFKKTKEEVCSFLTSMGYLNSEKGDNPNDVEINVTEESQQYSTEAFDDMLIKNCVDKLIEMGMADSLKWIQSSLIQVWNAKLVLKGAKPTKSNVHWEPLAYFCLAQGENVPITVYSDDQERLCKQPLFQSLISALEFGKEQEGIYFIQKDWSAEKLLSMAMLFGKVDSNDLMFTLEEVDAFLSLKRSKFTEIADADSGFSDCSTGEVPKVLWSAAVKLLNKDAASRSPLNT